MTMNDLDEDDSYFLDLLIQHPNLYQETHEFYNDPLMMKGSWGQIALAMAITGKQAQDKWQKLLDFYQEETVLRACEDVSEIQVAVADKSPYDFLYDRLQHILQQQLPATSCQTKTVTRVPAKNRLAKTTKKATIACKDLAQKLEKVVASTSELSSNAKIGKLIEAELQKLSPTTRALKRQQLMHCTLQHLGPCG